MRSLAAMNMDARRDDRRRCCRGHEDDPRVCMSDYCTECGLKMFCRLIRWRDAK